MVTKDKIILRKVKKIRLEEVKPRFWFIRNHSYEKIYDKYFHNDRLMGTGRQQVYLFNTENEKPFYLGDDGVTHQMLSNIAKTFIRDLKIKQILR